MKITIKSIEQTPFCLKLAQPIVVGEQQLKLRNGFYLNVKSKECPQHGKGELSPLPGLHQETLVEAIAQLHTLRSKLPITIDPAQALSLQLKTTLHPSLNYALEEAILDIMAHLDPSAYQALFHSNFDADGPELNALLTPPSIIQENYIEQLYFHWELRGVKTVKVKVGRLPLPQEKSLLDRLSSRPSPIKFRLDGNRKLSVETLSALLESINLKRLEYVEEPLLDHLHHQALHEKYGVSWAVDESLSHCLKTMEFPTGTTTWVAKPRLLGSIHYCRLLIKLAHREKYQVVISSCYESEYGMKSLTQLALMQNHYQPTAAGLDTLELFRS